MFLNVHGLVPAGQRENLSDYVLLVMFSASGMTEIESADWENEGEEPCLLQALPEDHMPIFYYDRCKGYMVGRSKAGFGGIIEESKKMTERTTMLEEAKEGRKDELYNNSAALRRFDRGEETQKPWSSLIPGELVQICAENSDEEDCKPQDQDRQEDFPPVLFQDLCRVCVEDQIPLRQFLLVRLYPAARVCLSDPFSVHFNNCIGLPYMTMVDDLRAEAGGNAVKTFSRKNSNAEEKVQVVTREFLGNSDLSYTFPLLRPATRTKKIGHLKHFGCQANYPLYTSGLLLGKFEGKAYERTLRRFHAEVLARVQRQIMMLCDASRARYGYLVLQANAAEVYVKLYSRNSETKVFCCLGSAGQLIHAVGNLYGIVLPMVVYCHSFADSDNAGSNLSELLFPPAQCFLLRQIFSTCVEVKSGVPIKAGNCNVGECVFVLRGVSPLGIRFLVILLVAVMPQRSRAQKSKFGESAFIGYIQNQQRTNHTNQLHCLSACFLSQLEPSSIAKALEDPDWVDAMQEEMQQFINQQVWKLVPLPDGKHAIGTKWILKNKRDARGIVVRNKARLVAQGHRQEEGIDYDEVFAPVARIEAIRLFLAFASYMGFLVYQLDVKSAFLYGEIEEEVYVTQPKGFEDPYFPKHVYRVVKALYGLHQAPRAWYARLSAFLLQHNYRRGTIDKTLFIKKDSRDILLVQVYVDDIIFGSTNKAWCDEFEVLMKGEFEMSAMGEMTFFLGLQVKQLPDGIFISQDKYVKDMLTKFDMESVRTATTPYEAAKTKLKDETDPPVNVHLYRSMIGSLMYLTASRPDIMFAVSACSRHQVTPLTSHLNAVKKIFKYLKGQPKLGLWYPKDSPFQLEAYSDSDYAGSHGDRKSTTGGCQFLGRRLISWQCKKQTIVATSSTEAEYVAAASCCAQVLWIQNQLLDYGFNFMNTKIFIDNQSTICIVKNPVFHQRTKHIEIRHHFIRDANEKNLIQVLKIHTNDNVADLLTKAFDGPRFEYLVVHIGMVVNTAAGCNIKTTFFLLTDVVSAGRTMILLLSFLLDALFLLVAMDYAADSVHMLVGILLLVDSFLLIRFCADSIMFLLTTLFLLVVNFFCCAQLDTAGWLVSATSHLVSAGSLHSCWCNNVSAA
ncbi:putative ribonuclease H-like domain-containing protein [Tanacetum coccineum]